MSSGTLYLVGTPIGNLGDLSPRARGVLSAVDLIACEDTRRTGGLLTHFGIEARMVSYFEGNERERTSQLLERLRAGGDVAVVSDAGMPGLSDPGFRLVRECADTGIDVRVVPGPSSAVAALVISGLPTDRFIFEGFLPRRAADRRARLEFLASDKRTLVFFESPRRLAKTLDEMRGAFGERKVAVARELTKLHEEMIRGDLTDVLAEINERGEMKGEVVLVVGGAGAPPAPDLDQLVAEARELVAGGMRKRAAAHRVADLHGVHANEIYKALLA